jgi:hypothetical protein
MTIVQETAVRAPLRLLLGRSAGAGRLDGAWWPQSRDLSVEFADLADNFPDRLGRIVKLTYSKSRWDPAPAWLRVGAGRLVRCRAFLGTADADRVVLRMSDNRSLDLMVVPAELDADSAARAMRAAASPANRLPALTLIAAAGPDACRWDDDGGSAALAHVART